METLAATTRFNPQRTEELDRLGDEMRSCRRIWMPRRPACWI
jgi:hypothetical protein